MKVQGHEDPQELLRRLQAHTLLFVGPERVGRRQTARWYATWLNCQEPGDTPCGHCASCRAAEAGSHPDYREIAPKATTASGRLSRRPELRIDQLVPRERGEPEPLSRWLEQRPHFRRRIGVIDHADTLTPAAANAFLKILEEPPSYAIIILIAPSRSAVLPTLASRATTVRFGVVLPEDPMIGASHPARRLGQIGELIAATQDPESFQHVLGVVDDYLRAIPKSLETALEAAEALEKLWLSEEAFDLPQLLRARLSELSPETYAAGLEAVARTEQALASYASPSLALPVLTLELRRLIRAAPAAG
ncbi:MAG TPA: hypothetical protein VF171_01700 [Trueperaceae bacterium]